MKKPKFYLSTPLYYPSGKWHMGHSYTTVCCDAIARYKRMSGFDVFYLTGTDDHGQKIEERAAAAGTTPKQFTDELIGSIKQLWKKLDISYDKFIRTSDDYHKEAVQKIFTHLYEKGEIYKAVYKGKYCTPCESFWTPSQLIEGKCPDCGRDVGDAEEECYFFRLSNYTDRVRKLLEETDFLSPESRVKEMVGNFLKDGLTDLAVSRTTIKWGIPVPFDPKHTIYVWVDALSNYITALGYMSGDDSLMKKYWPADLHMVGKEIVRFHSIIWPALLMALELPLPKKVYGHGWLLLAGDKMSKSKGNTADPFLLIDRYGIDAVRYYLLREVPFGSDGVYTSEAFLTRFNSDLANDLGNLVKRTTAMCCQYFGGKITNGGLEDEPDAALIIEINGLLEKVDKNIGELSCPKALEHIFALIGKANKYIDETKPWILGKDPGSAPRLERVLYNLLEAIRISAVLLMPFLTEGPVKILDALGLGAPGDFKNLSYGKVRQYSVREPEPVYMRVDVKKELAELEKLSVTPVTAEAAKAKENNDNGGAKKDMISIDEFDKIELRVGEVTACEKVEKADKLLKLTVKLGSETRTIVSGIAGSYSPEEMPGKQVVVVTNLKPVKMRGILSEGMVLCADNGDKVVLVSPEKITFTGGTVC